MIKLKDILIKMVEKVIILDQNSKGKIGGIPFEDGIERQIILDTPQLFFGNDLENVPVSNLKSLKNYGITKSKLLSAFKVHFRDEYGNDNVEKVFNSQYLPYLD